MENYEHFREFGTVVQNFPFSPSIPHRSSAICNMADHPVCTSSLQLRIKNFTKDLITGLGQGKLPLLAISKYRLANHPSQSLENRYGVYTESGSPEILSIHRKGSAQRLIVMLRVIQIIQQLLEENKHASKRDVYYTDPSIFRDQAAVDQALNDICIWFQCSRCALNVVSVSKGLVMGWLHYWEADRKIDCMKYDCTGLPIPVYTHQVCNIQSSAEYMLLVEKETVFQRLANDGFCKRNRCILISGRGYPDVATRSFLRLLKDKLNLPIFGLMDGDPYGLDILLTYTFGSIQMAYDAGALATPGIHWLGAHLSDCETFNIPERCLLPLSTKDKQKGQAILKRSYMEHLVPSWRVQLAAMLSRGIKFEVEAISAVSFSLLSEYYLPLKIKTASYI